MDKQNTKLELARNFNGVNVNGKRFFSRAIAEQITGMTRQTFIDRCRKNMIPTVEDCGKIFYDREAIIEAIEKGLFEKRKYARDKKKGYR